MSRRKPWWHDDRALLVAHRDRLVEHPDDAPSRAMNRNSQRVGMPCSRASRASAAHTLAVVGMDAVARELGLRRPLLRRVAEQRLDLRAHVERRERRLDAVHVGDERNVLDQGPVAHFGGGLLLLGFHDLGEVAERAGEENSAASLELVIASSDVNVEPSFRSAGSLSRCPMIRLSPVLGGTGEPFAVTLTQLLRDDEVAQDTPDCLFTCPAERVLGGGVPLADDSFVVHDDDAVERRVEHGFALGCGLAGLFDSVTQPEFGHHGGREPFGDLDLSWAPFPCVAVDRAQHSDHFALCRCQRHAEIGTEAELMERRPRCRRPGGSSCRRPRGGRRKQRCGGKSSWTAASALRPGSREFL